MSREELDKVFIKVVTPEFIEALEAFCKLNAPIEKFDTIDKALGEEGFWFYRGHRFGLQAVVTKCRSIHEKAVKIAAKLDPSTTPMK